MRRRISPATAISLVALFFALTGAGMAATGYRITSLWQIAPKVRHALRGHTGARGPAGPQGIAGATGAQGPEGTPAPTPRRGFSDSLFDTGATANLTTAHPTAEVFANCPDGQKVTGGGFEGSNEIVTTDTALPDLKTQWVVDAHLDPSATSGFVRVWAVCSG